MIYKNSYKKHTAIKTLRYCLVIILLLSKLLYSQEREFVQLINADSLVGKIINNESVRILNGNVHLVQEDITILCDKGIQYLESNKAELEGNVKIIQGNVTVTAPTGFYFGDIKKAFGNKGIVLNDGKVELSADSGNYFFDEKKAVFRGKVKLQDSITTLTSTQLIYFTETEKAIAFDDVEIIQGKSYIYSDTLTYFRKEKNSIAKGNVLIENRNDNVKIYCNHLENYEEKKISILTGEPLFIQIDTTENGKIDTLLISALRMESIRGENEYYTAIDSVRIWRGGFSSRNNVTKYFKEEGRIVTFKTDEAQPIFWYDENQSYGDSVEIFTKENRIHQAFIYGASFLITQDTLNPKRFNQLSGSFIRMDFDNSELKTVFVKGNALSIYYLYDENEPNGLNKASGDSTLIFLSNDKVDEIKLYGSPEGEYYPEEKILNKEKEFQLAGFFWNEDRPAKEMILSTRKLIKIEAETKAEAERD
jgi:lipopolysaccharide export system protein LptA